MIYDVECRTRIRAAHPGGVDLDRERNVVEVASDDTSRSHESCRTEKKTLWPG